MRLPRPIISREEEKKIRNYWLWLCMITIVAQSNECAGCFGRGGTNPNDGPFMNCRSILDIRDDYAIEIIEAMKKAQLIAIETQNASMASNDNNSNAAWNGALNNTTVSRGARVWFEDCRKITQLCTQLEREQASTEKRHEAAYSYTVQCRWPIENFLQAKIEKNPEKESDERQITDCIMRRWHQ